MCFFFKSVEPELTKIKKYKYFNLTEEKYNMFKNSGISDLQLEYLKLQNINLEELQVSQLRNYKFNKKKRRFKCSNV